MTAILFDVVVGLIVLISTIIALLRGFVREVLTILGLIGAVAVTWFFGHVLSGFYSKHLTGWAAKKIEDIPEDGITHLPLFAGRLELPIDFLAMIASYSSIFLVSFIILAALNFYVAGLVQESKLNIVDRSLGVAFGLARGVLLATLLYIPVALYIAEMEEKPAWVGEAQTAPLLQYGVDIIQTKFFPDAGEDLKAAAADIKNEAGKAAGGIDPRDILFGRDKDGENGAAGYDGEERIRLDQLIERELEQEAE
ncbi:MAG: CvpA family protein [Micavibrio sp.]|nr:MAG: CvpA family protein [Micavibrio sp.]